MREAVDRHRHRDYIAVVSISLLIILFYQPLII